MIAVALLATGVIYYATRERPPVVVAQKPVVVEGVRVVMPSFHDPRDLDPNTATIEELMALPGIGPVLAGRIVAYRTEHGPFASVEAMAAVSGIGPVLIEQLRELLTIDGTAPGGQ